MLDINQLASRLEKNADFGSSSKFFDGAVQLEIGLDKVWLKVFMGRVVFITQQPPPFGYTFAVKGSLDGWRFALEGPKNRFREALFAGRLLVEGNILEFSRIGKAVHGLTEVLREMIQADLLIFEEKA
jgi:hypothetical protein